MGPIRIGMQGRVPGEPHRLVIVLQGAEQVQGEANVPFTGFPINGVDWREWIYLASQVADIRYPPMV